MRRSTSATRSQSWSWRFQIRGDVVRLGIEAPKEVPVHRQEVYDAIRRDERRNEAGMPDEGGEE
jgi:carbon storage regulator